MRINTNIAALRAAYQVDRTDKQVSSSIGKLSSGSKLTDIKENPVGASLSVKMKTQIRNLDRAQQNTNDGISVIETAEGALAEVESMLQRINELAVQGASDSYTDSDREAIMKEINQIRDEIDRVSTDTDFNTKALLDGTFERKTYTNNIYTEITSLSDTVEAGDYVVGYLNTATKTTLSLNTISAGNIPDGSFTINGATVSLSSTDSLSDVYDKMSKAAEKTGLDLSYTGSMTTSLNITFTEKEYGSDKRISVSASDEMEAKLGFTEQRGLDSQVTLSTTPPSKLTSAATCTVSGRDFVIKDANGVEIKVKMNDKVSNIGTSPALIQIGVTDVGPMVVQIGANEYQELDIEIPRVDTETLGLDKIRAYTSTGAGEAITITLNAIDKVSAIRSKLGAYQNRMEHSVSTLAVTEENMTASYSRIADVDMAKEMTQYTTYNVMAQAATSMLAQANQMGDKVLQLLQ